MSKDKKTKALNPDEEPKILSREEVEEDYGVKLGPCRICGGQPNFYMQDNTDEDEADDNDPLREIVEGNYCMNCFLEMYPQTAVDMFNMAEKLDTWLKKRFSQ